MSISLDQFKSILLLKRIWLLFLLVSASSIEEVRCHDHDHDHDQHSNKNTSVGFDYTSYNWNNMEILRVPSVESTQGDEKRMERTITTSQISIGSEIFMPLQGPFISYNTTLPKDSWIIEFAVESFYENGNDTPSTTQPHVCHAWIQVPTYRVPLTISQGMNRMTIPDGFGVHIVTESESPLQLSLQIENQKIRHPLVHIRFRFVIVYTMIPQTTLLLDSLYLQAFGFVNKVGVSDTANDPNSIAQLPIEYPSDGRGGGQGNGEQSPLQQEWLKQHWLKQEAERGEEQDKKKINRNESANIGKYWTSTGSFLVPPGLHSFTKILPSSLPLFKQHCRIIFIKSHLHVHAVNFSLFDRSDNKILFTATATHTISPVTGEKLLVETSFYKSSVGIPIDPSHQYMLTAWYNNTTPFIVDGMAVFRVLYA